MGLIALIKDSPTTSVLHVYVERQDPSVCNSLTSVLQINPLEMRPISEL